MRVSVVIATSNRGPSLRQLLECLRYQTHRDFEVIVVKAPSSDDTERMLAERQDWLQVVDNPELNLSRSRNLGIDMAAGDVVAFIDDDAIPEPRWLAELVEPYADDEVGGAGGLVYDATGVNLQFRYAVCDRVGRTDFGQTPPLDDFNRPHADPFLYLQGTNMSFRRRALEEVGGFDENIEYVWDDVEIALQLLDRGWRLTPLSGAAVHHKVLPSSLRRDRGLITDPFTPVKNRTYFALRNGLTHHPAEQVVRSLSLHLDELRAAAAHSERYGRFTARERSRFLSRMEAGFDAGFELGMTIQRGGRSLLIPEADTFKAFPVVESDPDRLSVCLISVDYPPKPMGGIARYTVDLAHGLAARGHEVHVVTRADPPYRVEFEDGVWVHRYPESGRLLNSLPSHPARDNLIHIVTVWRTVADIARRFPVDLVAGNAWLAEPLVCCLDPRWPTVVTLSTPTRTIAATQPAVASKPEVTWQIKLEEQAVSVADQLHPISRANFVHVQRHVPSAAQMPAEVIWLGMADRAVHDGPPAPHDGVEILFVGRLEPRKGIDTLLEAGIKLLEERPNVRLRLAGAENPYASDDIRPYAERVREMLVADPAIFDRIIFAGEVTEPELDDLFRGCDVFCAPSRYESFGLMNIEAMMFARPLVSSRAGGIEEVVVDGETGLLVEPDDSAGLLEALRLLVDDPELRDRMGKAGRRRYESEFTDEIAVGRVLDLFRRTAERVKGERVTEASAEATVRSGLTKIVQALGIDDPGKVADELLDPSAFPYDYLAPISGLQTASDRDFIAGLYRAILRREADTDAFETRLPALARHEISRLDIVREVATSPEARALGVDSRFLDHLQAAEPTDLVRRVRAAFLADDERFAELLVEVFIPAHAPGEPEISWIRDALRAGATRRQVLSDLVSRSELRARMPDAPAVLEYEFLTPPDLERELAVLAGCNDAEFADALYRLLLGRSPGPEAVSDIVARLRGAPRSQIVQAVAQSAEAAGRGVDPGAVAAVVARIPQLRAPPRFRSASTLQRLERLPGGRRARQIARRVLRDPEVRQLAREVRELRGGIANYADFVQVAAHRSTRQVNRVASEVRGLSDQTQELTVLPAELRSLGQVLPANTADQLLHRLPPAGSYGTYIGDGRIVVGLTWGGVLLVPADDLSLTPELVAHGIYEGPFTRYLMRTLRPGFNVIDIGANIGMFTVLMAGRVGAEGHVTAYEPNPDVLSFLRTNVAVNWVSDRVTIRDVAVSSTSGRSKLYVTERFMANSSLLEPDEAYFANVPMDTVRDIEVDSEPLDEGVSSSDRVDLVKIDVEGAEYGVMSGMAAMLESGRIDRVCFELYEQRMGGLWPRFCDLLRGYHKQGWRFHEIMDDGTLHERVLEEMLDVGRYSQVVMARTEG